jgi:hypothetical protein
VQVQVQSSCAHRSLVCCVQLLLQLLPKGGLLLRCSVGCCFATRLHTLRPSAALLDPLQAQPSKHECECWSTFLAVNRCLGNLVTSCVLYRFFQALCRLASRLWPLLWVDCREIAKGLLKQACS